MHTLNETELHYVRCVKPNTVLKPGVYECVAPYLLYVLCAVCLCACVTGATGAAHAHSARDQSPTMSAA